MLIFNLGHNPEIVTMNNGKRAERFKIATSKKWIDKRTGEEKERTDWHTVLIFNEYLIKLVECYCKKGSQLYVEGKHQTRIYTDHEGICRYASMLLINGFGGNVLLLDQKEKDDVPPMQEPDDYQTGECAGYFILQAQHAIGPCKAHIFDKANGNQAKRDTLG